MSKTRFIAQIAAMASVLATSTLIAQKAEPVLAVDLRVAKLLCQLTLEEKLSLLHGAREDPDTYQGQAGYLARIPRLGVPGMRFADGPPGVLTRHVSQAETATMTTTLHVAPRQLQYWSTANAKSEFAQGKRTLIVGGSSLENQLETNVASDVKKMEARPSSE